MRICMWSGPRNLSTALMYAFGQRADCAIMDEPMYAAYLAISGAEHPMREEILSTHETDPRRVSALCAAEPAQGHVYQKHMVHHMLPGFDRGFMRGAANVFLIRHPSRVVASYAAKRENPTVEDIGALAQLDLWREVIAHGPAPVIDSDDIRKDPAGSLAALCEAIGLDFAPDMLRWPQGGRPEDGVWAAHWYGAVHRSTGFAGAEGPVPDLPPPLDSVARAAFPAYEALKAHALAVSR